MGATTFGTVQKGKNAKAAFLKAKEQARIEYGDRGYTGTIAEKPSFRMLNLPAKILGQFPIQVLREPLGQVHTLFLVVGMGTHDAVSSG